jgi:hypothetical protein
MRDRWVQGLLGAGLSLTLLGGSASAQTPQSWGTDLPRSGDSDPVRGTVSFFYRTNELMGDSGFTSFGPQLHLDGSLMGNRVFYSANFAYNRRERLARNEGDTPAAEDTELVGGARLGFRLGNKSVFEVEYSNDGFGDLNRDSVLFLSGQQQSSLSEIARGKSFFLALRNETQVGSVARLTTSFKYMDHTSALQLSSTAAGPLPDLLPDYLRRLEVHEDAEGQLQLFGLHQLETGVRFVLDQLGIRSSSGDLDGALNESRQMRATRVGFFLQDRWEALRGWNVHMGVAYELPGEGQMPRRSEWSIGLHRGAADQSLQYGVSTFLRNGFPQLADYGSQGPSLELAIPRDSAYQDELGLGRSNAANYGGIELFFTKQLARTFGLFLSYTYSHLRDFQHADQPEVAFGTVEADVPSLAAATSSATPRGPLFQQTHMVHLDTNYRVNSTLSLGSTLNYLYADPLDFVTAEVTLVRPHNVSVDMHLEKTLRLGDSKVDLMLDVFNLMNSGSLAAYDTHYDIELATIAGRRFQVGMRYGF